jgi:hypothetical protein
MSTPIITHETPHHASDEASHPIPSLVKLDVLGIRKSGGADLMIVINAPLQADARSQSRLLDKLQNYLQHIASPEYQREAGTPSPDNTTVVVSLHPDSASEIFALLERSIPWVLQNHARLKVELRNCVVQ